MKPLTPWLTIIGIGEDGLGGLPPPAHAALAQAQRVFGGARHLAMLGDTPAQTTPWPSPIEAAFDEILRHRAVATVILATGDPFHFGIGSLIAARLAPGEYQVFPAPSAFALAAARMGWGQQHCQTLSLHGRPLAAIVPYLQPGARILALSWDGHTPEKLAALLCARGLGDARLTVCENMGGTREKISAFRASEPPGSAFDPLNTIALEIPDAPAPFIPRNPGLPDEFFEHDGQITKRDVRAITLGALAPLAGQTLWDIGAGSGSVAIEWLLCDPTCRAFAIEAQAARSARIARNAKHLGVPQLQIITAKAPDALSGLPTPDAIFIGGGGTAPGLIETAMQALRPNGRLVINAVTLETQARLTQLMGAHGGQCLLIQISHADPVGRFHGWRAAMPVMQWRWQKPAPKASTAPVIAIGIGCRGDCTAQAIVDLVRAAMHSLAPALAATPAALYTIASKAGQPALREAAASMGMDLHFLDTEALAAAMPGVKTRSSRVQKLFGVAAIAEAAALAGAGPGAQLCLERLAANGVTCAIATLQAGDKP
ncbi:MAG: precorrin-6y C5,15-methyltransferase (decarboxylating) subunit CbiE [Hyphomicrobiales bacterium]|nr:precorrin-6y C5,15-methyltransferase (decarboxylating) subunit CbiE [Hyphomicrobiales bacterium]MDE2114713.1 precorrin-6y C5,15-methyltransferase (decarboxylating) subunit CbiE [Hyphomicrobiales bacterium]